MSVSIVPAATRRRADQLLQHADRWARGTRHTDGLALFTFAGSAPGAVYFASTLGCTCPGYRHRGVCCHSVAVSEHERARRQTPGAEHRPTSSPTSWRPCSRSCGELLPPEQPTRMCNSCFERIGRALDWIE